MIRANGGAAWFGWPADPQLEALRSAWFEAPDLAGQQALAQRLPAAWRRNVTGVFPMPATVYWNIGKED